MLHALKGNLKVEQQIGSDTEESEMDEDFLNKMKPPPYDFGEPKAMKSIQIVSGEAEIVTRKNVIAKSMFEQLIYLERKYAPILNSPMNVVLTNRLRNMIKRDVINVRIETHSFSDRLWQELGVILRKIHSSQYGTSHRVRTNDYHSIITQQNFGNQFQIRNKVDASTQTDSCVHVTSKCTEISTVLDRWEDLLENMEMALDNAKTAYKSTCHVILKQIHDETPEVINQSPIEKRMHVLSLKLNRVVEQSNDIKLKSVH